MSFKLEFYAASAQDAGKILLEEKQTLPLPVHAFIMQALQAYPDSAVYVKAVGHLYNADYKVSRAEIIIGDVVMRSPREKQD